MPERISSEAPPAHRGIGLAVRLGRERIYILPTRHGLGFVAALAVMLVGSANYDNSLGYLLTFLLTAVGLVSMLHTYRNLAGLVVGGRDPGAVFAGDSAALPLTIDNRGQPQRHAVLLSVPAELPRSPRASRRRLRRPAPEPIDLLATSVPADTLARHDLAVRFALRGVHPITGVVIASRFPLGLLRAWVPLDFSLRCVVYPRPLGRLPLPPPGRASPRGGAGAGGGEEDFSGLRNYQRGDSPKRVHWKLVARGREVPVKLFDGAHAGDLELRWEAAGDAGREERLSQLCRWVLDADKLGFRYRLVLPGTTIALGGGGEQRERCLRALATFGEPPAAGAFDASVASPPGTDRPRRRSDADPASSPSMA